MRQTDSELNDPKDKHRIGAKDQNAARLAHRLPYNWYALSPGELARLQARLADKAENAGEEERKVRLAIWAILTSGRRLADLHSLRLYRSPPTSECSDCGIFPDNQGQLFWKLPPGIAEPNSTSEEAQELESDEDGERLSDLDREKLPLTGRTPITWPSLGRVFDGHQNPRHFSEGLATRTSQKSRQRRILKNHEPTPLKNSQKEPRRQVYVAIHDRLQPLLPKLKDGQDSVRLFPGRFDTLWAGIRSFMRGPHETSEAHRTVASSVMALERQLWTELYHQAGGDNVEASRITNRKMARNCAASYYGETRLILLDLDYDTLPFGSLFSKDELFFSNSISSAIDRIIPGNRDDYFVALSDYTAAMVCFATGHRAHFDCLPATSSIDGETGFCVIDEKDSARKRKARIVWVPEAVQRQIRIYEHALSFQLKIGRMPNTEVIRAALDNGELVFPDLNGNNRSISQIVSSVFRVGLDTAKENAGRHWLRTQMAGKCSTETINAFFGHWSHGDNPWAHGSCFDPLAYRADLRRTLPKLIESAGWRVVGHDPHEKAIIRRPALQEKEHVGATSIDTFHSPFHGRCLGRDISGILTSERFDTALKDTETCAKNDVKLAMGRILATAIFRGALLNISCWPAFVVQVQRARRKGGSCWVELGSDGRAKNNRWLADELSYRLIVGWRREGLTWDTPDHLSALRSFLSRVDPTLTVEEFHLCATLRWRLRLPALLMDAALGELPCHSIRSGRWS